MKLIALFITLVSLSAGAQTTHFPSPLLPLPPPTDGLELRTQVDAVSLIAQLAETEKYKLASSELLKMGCKLKASTLGSILSLCGGQGIIAYNTYDCKTASSPTETKMALYSHIIASCKKVEVEVKIEPLIQEPNE